VLTRQIGLMLNTALLSVRSRDAPIILPTKSASTKMSFMCHREKSELHKIEMAEVCSNPPPHTHPPRTTPPIASLSHSVWSHFVISGHKKMFDLLHSSLHHSSPEFSLSQFLTVVTVTNTSFTVAALPRIFPVRCVGV
jgi:hypothetical protein